MKTNGKEVVAAVFVEIKKPTMRRKGEIIIFSGVEENREFVPGAVVDSIPYNDRIPKAQIGKAVKKEFAKEGLRVKTGKTENMLDAWKNIWGRIFRIECGSDGRLTPVPVKRDKYKDILEKITVGAKA